MATGTGFPVPKAGGALLQPPALMDGDRLSSASAWERIGKSIEGAAADLRGIAAREEAQAKAGELADRQVAIRQARTELRDKFADDPDGFQAAMADVGGKMIAESSPAIARDLQRSLAQETDSALGSILSEKRSRTQALASEAWNARREMSERDVMALASAGRLGEPEAQALVKQHRDILETGVSTGLIAPEKAELLRQDLAGKAEGEAAARSTRKVHEEQGYEAALEHARKTILENNALQMSPSARYQAHARAVAEANQLERLRRADRAEIVERGKDLRNRLEVDPRSVDASEVRDTLDAALRTGAFGEHARLSAKWATVQAVAPYRSGALTLGQFGRSIAAMRGDLPEGVPASAREAIVNAAAKYGEDPALLARIASIETGGRFDPNAVNRDSKASGLFQFIPKTWRQYGGGADVFDAGANADAAARLTRDNRNALRAGLGREPTNGEVYLAHQQGAQGALDLLSNPDAPAVSIVGLRAVTLNGGTPGMTAGQFAQKWIGKVDRGGAGAASLPSIGAVTKEAQRLFVGEAERAWPKMRDMIGRGETPSAEDLESILYAASISGNASWVKEVEGLGAAMGLAQRFAGQPAAVSRAQIDAVRSGLGPAGLTVDQDAIVQFLEKSFDRQQKLVRSDPVTFGIQTDPTVNAPMPIDLSSPERAKAGVAERVAIARRVAAAQEAPYGPPLRQADIAQISGALAYGKPGEALAAQAALLSIPPEMMEATLALSGLKDTIVGMSRSGDVHRMTLAYGFLDRDQQRDPLGFSHTYGADVVKNLAVWQSLIAFKSPEDIAAKIRRVNDPAEVQARKVLLDKAETIASTVTAADVLSAFADTRVPLLGWVIPGTTPDAPVSLRPAEAPESMRADWVGHFKEFYSELGDEKKARDLATRETGRKWGVSPTNGGRMMAHPPEKAVVRSAKGELVGMEVNGSSAWIGKQLDGFVRLKAGDMGIDLPVEGAPSAEEGAGAAAAFNAIVRRTPAQAKAERIYAAPRVLLADRQTEAEIARREPPSYQVIIQDPKDGRWHLLLDNTGPARFRPDREAAADEARIAAAGRRAALMQRQAEMLRNMEEIQRPLRDLDAVLRPQGE